MMTKQKKRSDNVKFVNDFMTWGSPVQQIFVMDAINILATAIVKQKDTLPGEIKNGFIESAAWIEYAKTWQAEFAENFK